jgi:hypothetical protein
MFFSRIYSFFFLLVSIGLFAHAKPIDSGLTVRDDFGNALEARNYPSSPCNCGHDLVDVLVALKAEIDVQAILLDGVKDPKGPCDAIVAALKVAIDLIAKIDLKVAFVDVDINLCVSLCVEIILAILACVSKYSLTIILSLCVQIDIYLALCLKACIKLCPAILVKIVLNVDIIAAVPKLTLYGFVSVLAVLGL